MKYTSGRFNRSRPAKCDTYKIRQVETPAPENARRLLAKSPEERSRLDRCLPSKAEKAPMVTQQTTFDIPIQPTGWILTRKLDTQDQMLRPEAQTNGTPGGSKRISTSRPITARQTHRMKVADLPNRS
jgi:hypothetical protein